MRARPRVPVFAFDVVPPHLLTPPDLPMHGSWRLDAAVVLDRQLIALAGMDAHSRRVQARLVRRFMDGRAWKTLGFVRLSDYARERLGVSPRSLEDDAHVMRALDETPRLRNAFESGVINWTQVRLLVRVATAGNERRLLERALRVPTRELEHFVRHFEPDDDASQDTGGSTRIFDGDGDYDGVEQRTGAGDGNGARVDERTANDDGKKRQRIAAAESDEEDPHLRWSMPVS